MLGFLFKLGVASSEAEIIVLSVERAPNARKHLRSSVGESFSGSTRYGVELAAYFRRRRGSCSGVPKNLRAPVRYTLLSRNPFDSIKQVQGTATRWLWTYNHECPNMAHGGIAPMQKLMLAA